MKKDLEWVRQEILREFEEEDRSQPYAHGFRDGLRIALSKINQLDEPEVLSQEWIDDVKMSGELICEDEYAHRHVWFIPEEELQDKLVPKQEEQSTETVADVVTTFWKSYERLKEVMSMEVEEQEE